jgi:hypothetical protein
VGLTLVGAGAIGGVIGTGYLVAGASAESQMTKLQQMDRAQYLMYQATAKTDGQRGMIATAVGGGLLVAGVIWFVTRPSHDEPVQVTGWFSAESSGLALGGRF